MIAASWGAFLIGAIGLPCAGLMFLLLGAFAREEIVHGPDPEWESVNKGEPK